MAITNTAEVKKKLGISSDDSTYDEFIDSNIDAAESVLFEEVGHHFEQHLSEVFYSADTISFDSAALKITDTNADFINDGFLAGMNIRVYNSFLNDGIYKLLSVETNNLYLSSVDKLTDESAGAEISISMVKIPEPAKLFIAKYLEFYLPSKAKRNGVESEKFDDYSVKYKDKSKGLPEEILNIIEPFKKLKWD